LHLPNWSHEPIISGHIKRLLLHRKINKIVVGFQESQQSFRLVVVGQLFADSQTDPEEGEAGRDVRADVERGELGHDLQHATTVGPETEGAGGDDAAVQNVDQNQRKSGQSWRSFA